METMLPTTQSYKREEHSGLALYFIVFTGFVISTSLSMARTSTQKKYSHDLDWLPKDSA